MSVASQWKLVSDWGLKKHRSAPPFESTWLRNDFAFHAFAVHVYVRAHLWEFHQIYNLGALGDKDELIRFWGQKVNDQCHSESIICWLCSFPALEFPLKRPLSFTRLCRDTIQLRWETFTLLCGKFSRDTTHQIFSESSTFCRRYDENILAYFLLGHGVVCFLYL